MRSKLVKIKRSILVNFILTLSEFNVHFRKDYMLYDQQTFSLKRFKKVYLYHDLYYFVDSENVVIVKKCQEVDRAIHKTPYLKVQKKDALFCLL